MAMQEKRKYPRFDVVSKIQFKKVEGPSDPKDALVKDISAEGFCFCSNEQLKTGENLEVEITEPAMKDVPIYIRGEVVWSEKAPESKDGENKGICLTGVKVLGIRKTDEARFAMLYCERLIAELKNFLHM